MARTLRNVAPLASYYRTATGPRTTPLTVARPRQEWHTDMGLVMAESRDADSVILIPQCRYWNGDESEEADEADASWREEESAFCCFKTSYAYQLINQKHPRIVPVLGQDAWTGLPILAKPSGGTLEQFIEKHLFRLYTEPLESAFSRIKKDFLPLAYQWSLQIASALCTIHSHGIAYGEITDALCWLSSPSLSISLAGFLGAEFQDTEKNWNFPGFFYSGEDFSPKYSNHEYGSKSPTVKTDIFIFGRIVYLMMTSLSPGDGMDKSWEEISQMVRDEEWPTLEHEYLGAIVHKCWNFGYDSMEEVLDELKALIQAEGWGIKGEDELDGLDINLIHRKLTGEEDADELRQEDQE